MAVRLLGLVGLVGAAVAPQQFGSGNFGAWLEHDDLPGDGSAVHVAVGDEEGSSPTPPRAAITRGGDHQPPLCTCLPMSLCKPIRTPLPEHHLVAFAEPVAELQNSSAWRSWNWGRITTIALAHSPPPDFICHAHANGVRVIQNAGVPYADPQPRPSKAPVRCGVGGWALQPVGFYKLVLGGCPAGKVIDRVVFASYGTPRGDCAHGFTVDKLCYNPNSTAIVAAACVGKTTCELSY